VEAIGSGALLARGNYEKSMEASRLHDGCEVLDFQQRVRIAVRDGHLAALGVDQPDLQVNSLLLDGDAQELARLELDLIPLGFSTPDLPLLGEAVVEERLGWRYRFRARGKNDEEKRYPTSGAAPAEKEGGPHSVVSLGGFTGRSLRPLSDGLL